MEIDGIGKKDGMEGRRKIDRKEKWVSKNPVMCIKRVLIYFNFCIAICYCLRNALHHPTFLGSHSMQHY